LRVIMAPILSFEPERTVRPLRQFPQYCGIEAKRFAVWQASALH
jgi:hypothetical protein